MLHYLSQLSPATIRVYAAALGHRRAFGEPPSAEVVRALALEEGASEGAALVLCRWQALSQHGSPMTLAANDPGWHVVVHDRETLLAILATERWPRARVYLFDGRPVPNRMLRMYAEGWDEAMAKVVTPLRGNEDRVPVKAP